ncbi:Na+/H+ antiporter subunit E [Ilumatobacter sp.]|uniref:Na+/H+ antiporter subunit E n=1 Tax=Ilumatobacter sp. TaxID=1967498 RepID=UPI003C3A94D2
MSVANLRRWWTFRRAVSIALLTVAWCALWGSLSAANVLSGLLVAAVATTLGNPPRHGGVRLGPLLRLVWLVAIDLVVSTTVVVREVLTPTDFTDEAIIAIPVPPGRRSHLLLMYVAITVTPGTAVVAAEADGSKIYLHVLHADRRADVEAHTLRLFDLASRALPLDESEVRS